MEGRLRLALKPDHTEGSRYAICSRRAAIWKGRRCRVIAGPELESSELIRVVDESSDDYVYLARRFELVS